MPIYTNQYFHIAGTRLNGLEADLGQFISHNSGSIHPDSIPDFVSGQKVETSDLQSVPHISHFSGTTFRRQPRRALEDGDVPAYEVSYYQAHSTMFEFGGHASLLYARPSFSI